MIKIIKKGTKQIRTCEECGCKFSFEEEDIEERKVNITRDSEVVVNKIIFCPQCRKSITIDECGMWRQ